MAEIASWNNHSFVVSPTLIRGFSDLTIKTGSATNDKTSSSQAYVTRKNGEAYELSMTVTLSGFLGCDVRNEAMTLLEEARNGKSDYFYIAGVKIVTCKLMLISASVDEVEMSGSAVWVSCKVKLTFKQCDKMDSAVSTSTTTKKSSSSSSSKKSSSSSNSKKTTTTGSYATMNASQLTVNKSTTKQDTNANAEKAKAAKASSTASKTTTVKKATSTAKTTSSAKKTTTSASNKATKTTYASIASTIANR